MNIVIRVSVFIGLYVVGVLTPFPFFIFCALLSVFLISGSEVLIIGVWIDSIFGTTTTSFLYTLSLGSLLIGATLLRPYLSWYTTKT